jgi:hypothetical protein
MESTLYNEQVWATHSQMAGTSIQSQRHNTSFYKNQTGKKSPRLSLSNLHNTSKIDSHRGSH